MQRLKSRSANSLAPVLMVQGTSSSVGKSLMVTGLCRAFARHGLRVAPFKAQNMALNSHVTRCGGEIGTAQAIQAEAARVEATVDMNPILLKPEAERRSQVVVKGKVVAAMSAMDYHNIKPQLRETIIDSLNQLRRDYDVVVIEGAGSPAEINLKKNDLVNMFVARSAQAPVLLVGDIDRGGVFAAFVGTMELLDDEEKNLVRAFIVNKFRGDVNLLKPGLEFLEDRCKRPVNGVLPFLPRLRIGDEDSIALDDKPQRLSSDPKKKNIAILRYPRISNYDEFNALEFESSLHVAYVQNPVDIFEADLLILPGSKSTVSDLQWLRMHGLDQAILRRAQAEKAIVAVCGGYQMLADDIYDPEQVESQATHTQGLGLLAARVQFQKEKTTCRVQVSVEAFDDGSMIDNVDGYEIHMGDVEVLAPNRSPHIRGSLVHGLFQDARYRLSLLKKLWRNETFDQQREVDPYDRLADHLEAHLDFQQIYELLNEQIKA